jgi:hypothetical protein
LGGCVPAAAILILLDDVGHVNDTSHAVIMPYGMTHSMTHSMIHSMARSSTNRGSA